MQEQWARILKARDLIVQVRQLVWWYYRPHLISIDIEKEYESTDDGGVEACYYDRHAETIEPETGEEEWIDAPYMATRQDPRLECILPYYQDSDWYCNIPPIIEDEGFDSNDITLTNPYPTLEQIEALVCEF